MHLFYYSFLFTSDYISSWYSKRYLSKCTSLHSTTQGAPWRQQYSSQYCEYQWYQYHIIAVQHSTTSSTTSSTAVLYCQHPPHTFTVFVQHSRSYLCVLQVLLQVLCVLLQVLRVLLQVLGPPAAPTHGLTNRSRWTSAVKCTAFSGHQHRKWPEVAFKIRAR